MKGTSSNLFSQIAHRLHPTIGKLYDGHSQFFNDGFVELLCLLIANIFIWFFSYLGFTQIILAVLVTCVGTPITFGIKYAMHKLWVWKK